MTKLIDGTAMKMLEKSAQPCANGTNVCAQDSLPQIARAAGKHPQGGAVSRMFAGECGEESLKNANANAAWAKATRSAPGASEAARKHLAQLRRQLRRERIMGRSGHFSYDLARHMALIQMVKQAEASQRAKIAG